MDFEQIDYSVDNCIATITLNRPTTLNAWTPTMSVEIFHAMKLSAQNSNVRVIIITGAGRGFCSGIDSNKIDSVSENTNRKRSMPINEFYLEGAQQSDYEGLFSYFPAVGKPIIAAINGPVAGSGLVLALSCDLRFAAESAIFSTSFARLGLVAEHGIAWLLNKIVGVTHTQDLLLSARRVSAKEAFAMGMLNNVFASHELLPQVYQYAQQLVENCSPRSLQIIKRQVWESLLENLSETVAKANVEMIKSFTSEDFKEGVKYIREKRKPCFIGQ